MTECTSDGVRFRAPSGHELVARFDGGEITSDGGAMLLRAADDRFDVLGRLARCFRDHRDPRRVEHTVEELLRQRVFGLALGYEDLVDHDELRTDPLLASMVGKRDPNGRRRREADRGKGLAGSRTLNRLELSRPESAQSDRYRRIAIDSEAVDRLLVDLFLESYDEPPEEIILDLDATDDPLHGRQEGRFFHGYYDCYCYLPLYIFAGEHLLCARLRRANIDGAHGSREELERIVPRIRERWPETRIVIRADSGFCRDGILEWSESQENVFYVVGIAKNARLVDRLSIWMKLAKSEHQRTGEKACHFTRFFYRTRSSWSRRRRVIGKAEHGRKGPNPRFVVTNLPCDDIEGVEAERIYREVYCARGDMENRIKEQQLYLFADRTSTGTMQGNQIRLYLSSFAYVLFSAIRRVALEGTELAKAQCGTIRNKLLKIGARVRVTVRRLWIHLSSSFPRQSLFQHALARLRAT